MKVPFYNLREAHGQCAGEIERAVLRVLRSGQYISGKEVERFEKSFAQYLSVPYVVAVNSGTAALHLALLALGVKPKDEIIIPSYTFAATAEAILYCGAAPVFVDIDANTYTIDPEAASAAITPKTVGIIPVHLYGQMADMETLNAIADKHKLWVVEDACQAHGASLMGKKVGTWAGVGVFSFYPTKNLGGIGEGGAIATHDESLAEFVRTARSHGAQKRYLHTILGYNYRLNEIQAAVLSVKLHYLNKNNTRRRELAALYSQILGGLPVRLPQEHSGFTHVYHQYTLRTNKRDELQEYLTAQGIETSIHYPLPLHLQKAFRNQGRKGGSLETAEQLAQEIVSLPLYPQLSEEEIKYVGEHVTEFFSRALI